MDLNVNIWVGLSIFGFAQGIFLSVVLFFHKRGNINANKFLAVFILLFSLRLGEFAAYWTTFFINYPYLIFATSSFLFLFGVLFYFYIRYSIDRNFVFKKVHLLHFIPFIIQFSLLLPFYLQGSDYKLSVFNNIILSDSPTFTIRYFVTRSLQNLHILIYIVVSFLLINKYKSRLNGSINGLIKINVRWLKNLTAGFAFFVFLDTIHLIDLGLFGYQHISTIDSILMFVYALLIYLLGYLALRNPEIYSGDLSSKKINKYEKSSLTKQKSEKYIKKLHEAMEIEKLFLKNDLSLQKLSEHLNISSNHLSQIINETLNHNFFDLINGYRVEEAKKMLMDPDNNLTILSIAHDSGFNNKASFNSAFKKHTGITPSDFRKEKKSFN